MVCFSFTGSAKRLNRDAGISKLLLLHIESQLQERIIEEIDVLAHRIQRIKSTSAKAVEAAAGLEQNGKSLREISEQDLKMIRTGILPYHLSGILALLDTRQMTYEETSRPKPIDLTHQAMGQDIPEIPVLPLFLGESGIEAKALPDASLPLYQLSRTMPPWTHGKLTATLASMGRSRSDLPVGVFSTPQSRALHKENDGIALAKALWRLRMWSHQGWSGGGRSLDNGLMVHGYRQAMEGKLHEKW